MDKKKKAKTVKATPTKAVATKKAAKAQLKNDESDDGITTDEEEETEEEIEEGGRWIKSNARKILMIWLKTEKISLEVNFEEDEMLYEKHDEFKRHKKSAWHRRLNACRNIVKKKVAAAEEELKCYKNFRGKNPVQTQNRFGTPNWQGSNAEALFLYDIGTGEYEKYQKPKDFYLSRLEYQEFPLDVFRDQIYQHKRAGKFNNYVEDKKKKLKKKLGI